MSICLDIVFSAGFIDKYAYAVACYIDVQSERYKPVLDFSLGDHSKLSKKLYVGNLSFDATEEQVRELFAEHGAVESVAMITDRDTGRFRGFCFVEMETSAANAAIKALDGKDVDGRDLRVNEAKPREERSGGGGGQRNGSSRGGQYGGNNRNRRNDYSNSGGDRRW